MNLTIIPAFLEPEECEVIISLAAGYLQPSEGTNVVTGRSEISDYRTSYHAFIVGHDDPKTAWIDWRLSKLAGIPLEYGEDIQVVHYLPGEYYKVHNDWFDPKQPGSEVVLKHGGQRVRTIMVYLNDVLTGGETHFPCTGVRISPTMGKAIMFDLTDVHGDIAKDVSHEGCPPREGSEKWIATKWFREKRFR